MNNENIYALLSLILVSVCLSAQVNIAQWNFNSPTPDADPTTGTANPSEGSGTMLTVGGTSSSFTSAGTGSSDSASTDNSALTLTGFPSQSSDNETAGVEFRVSTERYRNIVIKWDQNWSNASSSYIRIQYSMNAGSSWFNYVEGGDTTKNLYFAKAGGNTWRNGIVADFSNVGGVADNPDFRFKILTHYAPDTNIYEPANAASTYDGNASISLDMVTVTGEYFLGEFDLSTPPDQLFLTSNSTSNFPVIFRWFKSRNTNGYDLLLDNLNGNFSNPVFHEMVSGNEGDTVVNTTIREVDSLLNTLGYAPGDTFHAIWTIKSYHQYDTTFANNTWRITFFRDIPLGAFSLTTPSDNSRIEAEAGNFDPFSMSWASSVNATSYEVMFDYPGVNFSNPHYSLLSDNSGMDNALSLSLSDLDFHLDQMGVSSGDSVELIWRVLASNSAYELYSSETFEVKFIRKDVSPADFDLIEPVSQALLMTERENETDSFTFRWHASDKATNYVVVMDLPGGDIQNSPVQFVSNLDPSDTFLTMSIGDWDMMFESGHFNIFMGDTIDLEWGVVAWNQGVPKLSSQIRPIQVSRKILLGDFELLTPENNKRVPVINNSDIELKFEWTSSENAMNYELRFDTENGNFTNPLFSFKSDLNGMSTQANINYAILDSLLQLNVGVGNGDSVRLKWTVVSGSKQVTKFANEPYFIKFERVVKMGNFELITPTKGKVLKVKNQAGLAESFTWSRSNFAKTYEVVFDSLNGDFSEPILSLPSANNGNELFLGVPHQTLFDLISNQAAISADSLEVKWSVKAIAPSFEILQKKIWVDADRNATNNDGIKFEGFQSNTTNTGVCKNGLVLSLFHPKNLELMFHPNHEPDCNSGKLWPPYTSYKYQAYYTFNTTQKNDRDRFVDLINDLEPGTYVALFSRNNAGFSGWEQEIYDALAGLGCKEVLNLTNDQAAYVMIGTKGGEAGTALEDIAIYDASIANSGYASVEGEISTIFGEPEKLADVPFELLLIKDHSANRNEIEANQTTYQLYPNPTSGVIQINSLKSTKNNFQLTDIQGRILLSGTFEESVLLDLSKFSAGFYTINIAGTQGNFSSKIVKN